MLTINRVEELVMGDYKISMNINIEDIKNSSATTSVDVELDVTDEEACSIDSMEKILLSMDKELLRDVISQHFERVSKKKPELKEKELEEMLRKIRNRIK